MDRLLIVSNRLPVNIIKSGGGIHSQFSVGGLATGLGSLYKSYSYKNLWIGWPGINLEKIKGKEKDVETKLKFENCYPIFLSQQDIEKYYLGFCNKTIWPLFHYFTQYTVYSKTFWKAYKKVNEDFGDVVVKIAKKDDIIWIHDYHLMLLPKIIRDKREDLMIGYFHHIPFPSFEVFRLLSWRREIIEGLLGADLVGFHTYDYVDHFLDSVSRILGYEQSFGQITTDKRIVKVDIFPMGINYNRYKDTADTKEVQKEKNKILRKIGIDQKVIVSIDRLDYTKGILQRLESFSIFLEKNPEYREKVTFFLVISPSRTNVEHYILLKNQVDELVGKINGNYGTIGWTPVLYLYRKIPFHTLVALYNIADVALITPLRDGMNLIAKEYIAAKADYKGVLILSEMAGAAKELGEAIIINPNNNEEVAESLKEALAMPDEEQIARLKPMQERLKRYNVERWANDFMESLSYIKKIQQELIARKLTDDTERKLLTDYSKSENRLILLDYDGTLVPFNDKPEKAKPDDELLGLLKGLSNESKTEVVIISGRNKSNLEEWFGNLNMGFVAEHGVWLKEKGGVWEMIEPLRNDWKEEICPILELYVDRTPNSFIEEKEFSLVWHYRKTDPELGSLRARELKDAILHLIANLNLGVLEGSKVIEIKNIGINKGRAALRWISKKNRDFILAVGDDLTDEDIFATLPSTAYSIKVGLSPSRSKFNVNSVEDVKILLKKLVEKNV
jgi:trehalose 6-phosphate synthase/phosphatase